MNLAVLRQKDWEEFAKIFPEAENFLLRRSLLREYEILSRNRFKNAWQINRHAMLENWYKNVYLPSIEKEEDFNRVMAEVYADVDIDTLTLDAKDAPF